MSNTDYNEGWDAGYKAGTGADFPITSEAALKVRISELEDKLFIVRRRQAERIDHIRTLQRECDILEGACDF